MDAQKNKEIVRRVVEEPWDGSLEVFDECLDPSYVSYDPSQPEPVRGIEGAKEFIDTFRSAYSDGRVTVDEQYADGETVTTRWTGRGTHDGELMGIPPTGKQVTVSGITISRVSDGKVVEEYQNWDTLGMLQQLGAVPEMAEAR